MITDIDILGPRILGALFLLNKKMKKLFFLLVLGASIGLVAQNKGSARTFPNESLQRLQDKNFYLFTAITGDQEVSAILRNDTTLQAFLKPLYSEKKGNPELKNGEEVIRPFLWNDQDIATIGKRLVQLSKKYKAMANVTRKLKESHSYANFEGYSDDDLWYKSWELCAKGIDTILEVYGLGKAPLYDQIDSVSFDVHSKMYTYGLNIQKDMVLERPMEETLFFQPGLELSLSLLYTNHRDEAVRYEPLEEKENSKAVKAIGALDFSDYEYATIVVLGGGPENYRDRLSIMGKINLLLAIREYREGKAPFIIVSGGHVHPNRTPYCEAVEMKKELVQIYGVPEERVIIEPHARHTTTNMRNVTRLMLRYDIPIDKKSLVVTNPRHSSYLGSDAFKERCAIELGYQPVNLQGRLSPSTMEFTGNRQSLHQNPYQPLDP
ncbi:YdcF family protein [Maribacter polysaccharolyticus]|uniref:YdcF family protein n=1 Tax=Maribacter polysaccharolyticus TaxID=3020831 RepID=UPI00237F2999|nr:YdcF family protein [Maribacter polysaccharolyticus]MDE3741765.1 YdcF family protein [Maribacter polysaccharolyticus]